MAQFSLLGLIMVSLSIIGITMNSLGIWIFITKKKYNSSFHRILTWLLIGDNLYLFCTIISSFYFDFSFKEVIWILPYFVLPFKDIARTVCLLTTIYLSYERYLICEDPGKLKRSTKKHEARHGKCKLIKVMVFVWIFSVFYNILRFFVYTIDDNLIKCTNPKMVQLDRPILTNNNTNRLQKTCLRDNEDYKLYYKGVRWIIFTSFTLGFLVFLNWMVYDKINQTLRSCNRKQVSKEDILLENTNSKINLQFFKIMHRREKLVFTLFLLVICNLICSSLKLAEETIQALDLRPDGLKELQMLARLMITINSSINALIYFTSDKKFRYYLLSDIKRSINFVSCKYFFQLELKNDKPKKNRSSSDQESSKKSTNEVSIS